MRFGRGADPPGSRSAEQRAHARPAIRTAASASQISGRLWTDDAGGGSRTRLDGWIGRSRERPSSGCAWICGGRAAVGPAFTLEGLAWPATSN